MNSIAVDDVTIDLHYLHANGINIQVASAGRGPAVLLLHGWPFTWYVWHRVIPLLVHSGLRVLAPDLRGIGGTSKPATGYDAQTLADDACGLLDSLGEPTAHIVGFDLGLRPALMLALRYAQRVKSLTLTEALVGGLAGAEQFLAAGPPWWFGFHGIPGLAEQVLAGHEREYLNWFFRRSTVQTLSEASREMYIRAYAQPDGLRGGFEHYRAFPSEAEQFRLTLAERRLARPTLVIGGGVVKDAPYRQLQPFADDIEYQQIEKCGHVTPQEQPEVFTSLLTDFFGRHT